MKIYQYTYGRGDVDGYNASAHSEGAARLVEQWMQGKTRACLLNNELPVMEVQFCGGMQEEPKVVLCSSRHVLNQYEMQNGTIQAISSTRPYDYTHYLILQLQEEQKSAEELAHLSLKTLLNTDLFLTPYSFQQAVNDSEKLLPNLLVDEKALNDLWNACENSISPKPMLTDWKMSVFLARYWEACWNRKRKAKSIQPLLVIATSPNRANETKATTIVQDGIVFFHEHVIPFLPDAVLKMFSVSMGCLGEALHAQEGTACMVCYPTALANDLERVYRPYNDTINDNQLNTIYLRLGTMLRERTLPESYLVLRGQKKYETAEQDFDIIVAIVELEEILNQFGVAIQGDALQQYMLESGNKLMALEKMLRKDGLSIEDAYAVLLPLRKRLAEQCYSFIQDYNSTLYHQWIDLYTRIPENAPSEFKELDEKNWIRLLSKKYEKISWDKDGPLFQLAELALKTKNTDAFLAWMENGQTFDRLLGDDEKERFLEIQQIQQVLRVAGMDRAAEQTLLFLVDHCEPDEKNLSPIAYLHAFSEKQFTAERKAGFILDLQLLIRRHNRIITQKNSFNLQDAWSELSTHKQLVQILSSTPFQFSLAEITALTVENEQFLLDWSCKNQDTFYEDYYSFMLECAVQLPKRWALLLPETQGNLQKVYSTYLLKHFERCETNHHPLMNIMALGCEDTKPWETSIATNALEDSKPACDSDHLLKRLIMLHECGEHECAEIYLKLQIQKWPNDTDFINQYLKCAQQIEDTWSRKDVFQLLEATPEEMLREKLDIQLLGNWYKSCGSASHEELIKSVERLFVNRLCQAQTDFRGLEDITALYYTKIYDKNQDTTPFIEQIYAPFHNKTLKENTEKQESFAAVKYLSENTEKGKKQAEVLLRESIACSREEGLEQRDILRTINFSIWSGIGLCCDEIIQIVKDDLVSGKPLSAEMLSVLKEYAQMDPEFLNQLIGFMTKRAYSDACANCKNFTHEAIYFLNQCSVDQEKKEQNLALILSKILKNENKFSLDDSTWRNILQIAQEADSTSKAQLKRQIMDLFEWVPAPYSVILLELAVKALNITYKDVHYDTMPRWIEFFFQNTEKKLCSELQSNTHSLEELIAKATSGEMESVIILNELSDRIDSKKQEETRRHLRTSIQGMLEKDEKLRNPDTLLKMIDEALTLQEGQKEYVTECVLAEAFNHFAHLLSNDDCFSQLLKKNDVQVLHNVKRCFEKLDAAVSAQISEKKKVISAAFRIMETEDKLAENQLDYRAELHQMIQEVKLPGWQWVKDIVDEHGNEKLKNSGIELQFIPKLLQSVTESGGQMLIDWNAFLDKVFPLGTEGTWAQTDIWKPSLHNTFCKLATVFEWLSTEGLEEERGLFIHFLDSNEIGIKAKNKAEIKQLKKHMDRKTMNGLNNGILKWLLSEGM